MKGENPDIAQKEGAEADVTAVAHRLGAWGDKVRHAGSSALVLGSKTEDL